MYKFVNYSEADFVSWCRQYLINKIPQIKMYHKIQDSGIHKTTKPFDSFMYYKDMFCAIEYKLREPYSSINTVHPITILEEGKKGYICQREAMPIVHNNHDITLIIVCEYSVYQDEFTKSKRGTDNIIFYTYKNLVEKSMGLRVRRTSDAVVTFIDLLEEEYQKNIRLKHLKYSTLLNI